MNRYLLIILVICCLPISAYTQPPPATRAYGTDVGAEAAEKQRMERHQTKSIAKSNKSEKDYVNRIENQEYLQNQAYLDAKTSAEITVDEATGITTIKWNDGAAYQGQTYYGEIKGIGTMVYPDGSKYCGSWERDLPNGQGTFQTPEGIMYTVNFENGIPHGKGVIQDIDGRKYSARWVRGVLKEKSIKPYKEE